MYCPNCGKEVKEYDNFCRFCGANLRYEQETKEVQPKVEKTEFDNKFMQVEEEFVLYEVEKHPISLAMPVFLTPLFFFYFWNIFLNTHSFLSWIVVIAILLLIIYPVARYKSDKFVITNKFAHIKIGILNPIETSVPIEDLNSINVTQSSLGRIFDYGRVEVSDFNATVDYGNIKSPGDLQYIIDNPAGFIQEALEEEVSV